MKFYELGSVGRMYNGIQKHIDKNIDRIAAYSQKVATLYNNCYRSTAESALKEMDDGSLFVLTGDIPAMWLRDSAAQVNHYLKLVDDPEIANMIKRVIEKQFSYILMDPYANAFNESANGHGHNLDLPTPIPWVWERKYEIDSLCYPLQLAYLYWKNTGRTHHFNELFLKTLKTHQINIVLPHFGHGTKN